MKKIAAFAIITALALAGVYITRKRQAVDPLAGQRPENVSIVQLHVFPKRYEGKKVSVYGYFSNISKSMPTIYINEMYAKASDTSMGVIIDNRMSIIISDQVFNIYKYKNFDIIDGCFINVWGNFSGGVTLTGAIYIYIDDDCKKRFSRSDIIQKGALADFKKQ